ncbi:MAG: PEGA domain-containing protein [Clostridiales bacterium]|jgi:hypothetical protein|nr:PEGA domain-containing protein [Clostridiales bacterium]
MPDPRYPRDHSSSGEPRRPRKREYDGVIYEPSESARRMSERGRPVNAASNPPRRRPAPRPPEKPKTKLAVFYILTLVAGVAVCLVLFSMAFQAMTQNGSPIRGTVEPTQTSQILGIGDNDGETQVSTGMITQMNNTDRELTLLDINSNRPLSFAATEATAIKNRYGTPIAFHELSPGDIVDASYDEKTMKLEALSENTYTNELRNKRDVAIDMENWTIKTGNDEYKFNSQTLVLYRGEPYPIGQITNSDMVTLTEYNKTVWRVTLESSHGFLAIENAGQVVGGTVAIDSSYFKGLDEIDGPVVLSEGTHRVVIEGYNIDQFIKDATIRPNETTVIDLADTQAKSAYLRVLPSEEDSIVIIDGVEVDALLPTEVTFGEHTIRVEKDGFTPVEQVVTVTRPEAEVPIQLEKIITKSRVTVNTEPAQVEIYIDNVFVGYSPLTYDCDSGAHTITGTKPGYQSRTIEIDAVEGDNTYLLYLFPITEDPLSGLPSNPAQPSPSQNYFPTPAPSQNYFPTPSPSQNYFPTPSPVQNYFATPTPAQNYYVSPTPAQNYYVSPTPDPASAQPTSAPPTPTAYDPFAPIPPGDPFFTNPGTAPTQAPFTPFVPTGEANPL